MANFAKTADNYNVLRMYKLHKKKAQHLAGLSMYLMLEVITQDLCFLEAE